MNNTDLIWRNLSDFWGRIPEQDRSVIETLWNGWSQCIDAEYAQLYNIDLAKSLETCPVFSKFRWCLLDLTQKNLNKIKDYISSIRRDTFVTQIKSSAINTDLSVANHVDHRHFYIRPISFNQEIKLPFNIESALVEGYRIDNGKELYLGPDYTIDGNSIKLGSSISNLTDVAFFVGINETNLDENYTWNRYSEYSSGKKTFILPNIYDSSIGVMVFIDNKYVNQDELTYETSNTITINSTVNGLVEFIWYVKDPLAEISQFHKHLRQVFIYNPDAVSGTGSAGSVSYLPLNPPQSIDPVTRYSGPESQIKLFVKGKFYPNDYWTYDSGNGIIIFNTPIIWDASTFVPIEVEFSDTQKDEFESGHIHVIRQYSNVQATLTASTFDDGGRFDDSGFFDSTDEVNKFTLDFEVEDVNSLRVFFNGLYLYNQYDYTISNDKKTLYFKFPIKDGNFRFEYERLAGRYSYGATDLDGLTPDQIRKVNLMLFYNEDRELMSEFDVNSPEVDSKATDAYSLASQDIYCVSIPVLQDKVDNSTIKYIEKTLSNKGQYKIVYGGIQSDIKLPEYLWCPVVYFDESFLAKNFGILVNYVKKESSEPYKQALKAVWSGLWNGPVIQNVEWIISMFLNIPYIPEDGIITSISKSLVYTEILTDSEKYYLSKNKSTTLQVGDPVYLGQSLESKSKLSGETSFSSSGELGSTRLSIPNITVFSKIGDLISILSGAANGVYKVVGTDEDALIIDKPLGGSVGLIQQDVFDATVLYDVLNNSIHSPQFSKNIEVGSYIYFPDVYATIKIVGKNNGDLILESIPPITIQDGVNFIVFNKTLYSIVESGAYPYVKRNSIVRSINRVYTNRITLNNGKYVDVPSVFNLDVSVGQKVERFQPVSYQVAVYDHELRNDWLYENNSAFNEDSNTVSDSTERVLYSICDINNSWIIDPNGDFIGKVKIGDEVRFSSGVNNNPISYRITLVKNDRFKIANELINDSQVNYSVDRITKPSSVSNLTRQVSVPEPIEVSLIDGITASTLNIRVNDIDKLPSSGVLKAVSGENVEFIKYGYKIDNELRDCIRLYNKNSGNISLPLPSGHTLDLVFEYSTQTLREVFYAGVRSISDLIDNNFITDNQEALYNVIKNNTTIIEMFAESGINQPDLVNITDFMRRILPSSSFWFIDINKSISDVDERDPEESIVLSGKTFTCIKLTEVASYINNGTVATVTVINSSNINISDYVYISSFTNKYAKIVDVSGTVLTLDRLLDPTATVSVDIISTVNSGTCESQVLNPNYPLDPAIQKGCIVTILEGLNVGVYTIDMVIGNKIYIEGKFIESGNSVRYPFIVTSNEVTL